jgi:hypothetical protein
MNMRDPGILCPPIPTAAQLSPRAMAMLKYISSLLVSCGMLSAKATDCVGAMKVDCAAREGVIRTLHRPVSIFALRPRTDYVSILS